MSQKTISVGKKAPEISVFDKSEKKISLKDLGKQKKVIYFYPKDDTPGCTIEAKEFSDALAHFKKRKTVVVGISGGTAKTKQKFCDKYKLAHILATDEDFSVAKKWGSFGKKKFMGREYEGIFRNTYVLDENNNVIKVFESVTPKGHAKEVLEFLDAKGTTAVKNNKAVKTKVAAKSAVVKPLQAGKKKAVKKVVKKTVAKKAVAKSRKLSTKK